MKKDKKYSVVIREEYVGGVTLAYEEFYNEEFSLHVIEKIAKGFDLKLDEYDDFCVMRKLEEYSAYSFKVTRWVFATPEAAEAIKDYYQ